MSRFVIYTVHHLCSGFDNEKERQSAPLPRPRIALPRAAPSPRCAGETGTRKPPGMSEECLCAAPAHVHRARAVFFTAGAQLAAHTQPALRTGLMAPAWRLLHVSRRVILDLTWVSVRGRSVSCPRSPGHFREPTPPISQAASVPYGLVLVRFRVRFR